jgi:hypothetical protein
MLRKGKAKNILDSSIDSALLAVEIYNKPRTPFRVENYISLMIIAWTKLFHAYFYHTIGDIFYHKKRNSNRYIIVDGERKAWELKTCINKCKLLEEPVKKNLDFFIKFRNKIEHRYFSKEDIGVDIFGECQSLLYNYENVLVQMFGEEYSLNENLAFSLQFSSMRTKEQYMASKKMLSRDIKEIRGFIEKYRSDLSGDIFSSQEYSIRLIQIPKILNNPKKNVPAIEFVNWSNLSEDDRKNYKKIIALLKNKTVKFETINPGKLRAGEVVKKVLEDTAIKKINHYDHKCLYYLFSIRPISEENLDPFETNTKYCHYDEVHKDYVYQDLWPNFLIKIINENKITHKKWIQKFKNRQKLDIKEFE